MGRGSIIKRNWKTVFSSTNCIRGQTGEAAGKAILESQQRRLRQDCEMGPASATQVDPFSKTEEKKGSRRETEAEKERDRETEAGEGRRSRGLIVYRGGEDEWRAGREFCRKELQCRGRK